MAAAKSDLVRAGYAADAGLLNAGRLNTAWQKLDAKAKSEYIAARTEHGGKSKRVKSDKSGSKRERAADAQANSEIARSLGLNGAPLGVSDGDGDGALGDDDDLFGSRGFTVEAVAEGSTDERVYSHPMTGAVLHESGTFDSSSSILIVRVSSAGLSSQVGEPKKVDKCTLEIPVSRQNQPTFVQQLAPKAEQDAIVKRRNQLDITLKELYGQHMDFEVLDRAFKAMVPDTESWKILVTIGAPYMIGDMKKVLVCKAKNSVDAMVIIPLIREEPDVQERPITMDFGDN